ncbi:MAG: 50S ribosomal protein L22 [Candidatus Nanosyncoccaceae bacterium]|jgi:large subunit ribosomal protein L22
MKRVEVKAYAKGVQQAPRKVSIIASLIKGQALEDALVILDHTPRRAALPVKKALESARANALHNNNLDINSLAIEKVVVSTGKRLKRYKPASRGRALPIKKKESNILVVLSGVEKTKSKTTKTTTKTTTKKKEAK